jgi:hypothetical protein
MKVYTFKYGMLWLASRGGRGPFSDQETAHEYGCAINEEFWTTQLTAA